MVGIYKIQSPTGKVYIGQSWNIEKRIGKYKEDKCVSQRKLLSSILKHGFGAHEFKIMHELPKDIEQSILNIYEGIYIDFYKAAGIELLNIREAGSRGKHSDETKLRMKGNLGKWMKGRNLSDETKAKIALWSVGNNYAKGYKHTKDALNRIQKSCVGRGAKPILQFSKSGILVKEWASTSEASKELKLHTSIIHRSLRKIRVSGGGFIWKYKN